MQKFQSIYGVKHMCEKTLETYWYVANESRLHVQKSSPGPRDKPENNRIKVSS